MKKTFFGYKGSVDLKLTINNRIFELKTHNNGTDYLKKAFTKWLTGNSNTFDTPQFVDLRRQENENFITCLNQDISITGKIFLQTTDDDLNNVWVARFNAAIPYSAIAFSRDVFEDFDDGNFRLYLLSGWDSSESTYHDLAYIDLKTGSGTEISNFTSGTQMVIEWNMTLLNLEDFGISEDDNSNNSNSDNSSDISSGNYTSNNSNDTSNTDDESNSSNNNQSDNSEIGNVEGPSDITGNEGDDSGGDNETNPYTPIS